MSGEHDEHDDLPPDEAELECGVLTSGVFEPPDSPTRARSRRARLLRRTGVFAVLVMVVAALIYSVRAAIPASPPLPATPMAVASFLSPTGLGCVRSAAWDPTSTYIALVGTLDTVCGNGSYSGNVVNIYRARTAALVRQLHPDTAVFAALGVRQPPAATPTPNAPPHYPQLTYQTLCWSPDGARLAITFTLLISFSPSSMPQFSAIFGLVLLNADGSHERVLTGNLPNGPAPPQGTQPAYEVWDTQSGALNLVSSATPSSTSQDVSPSSLPAALSYTWDGGTLIPGTPLSASTPPPAPSLDLVGNPDGGSAFGLWQPGQIGITAEPVAGQQAPIYLYSFGTSFAAWSPDGRYFTDDLNMGGLLLSPGQPLPSRSVLKMAQLDGAVMLPVRDASLQQALAHDFPLPLRLGNNLPNSTFPIAWRPDGKVLAILNQDNGFTLRSAATGRIVRAVGLISLPASSLAGPGAFGTTDTLLWSPDGTWLLLPSLALVHVGRLNV